MKRASDVDVVAVGFCLGVVLLAVFCTILGSCCHAIDPKGPCAGQPLCLEEPDGGPG